MGIVRGTDRRLFTRRRFLGFLSGSAVVVGDAKVGVCSAVAIIPPGITMSAGSSVGGSVPTARRFSRLRRWYSARQADPQNIVPLRASGSTSLEHSGNLHFIQPA